MSLPSAYTAPAFEPPFRILVLIGATAGWQAATAEEKALALERMRELLEGVERRGARLVGSVDDDLFVTGHPTSMAYSISILYDVDDLTPIVEMVHDLRSSELAPLLRMEARVGRPLFLLNK
jgi:hypothetical protein